MPFKTEKIAIKDPFLDRRTKLIPCQKEMVKYWYEKGLSITKIAKMFKVNKRLIQFVLFPDRKKINLEHRKERGGSKIYYKKEYNNRKIREHRNYKHKEIINFLINKP